MLFRSLCGTAGTLGLVDVSSIAGELELALVDGGDTEGHKERLGAAIEAAQVSISQYLNSASTTAPVQPSTVNTTEIVRLVDLAIQATDNLSPDDVEPLLLEIEPLLPHIYRRVLRVAQDAVSRFDFKEAKRALQKLGEQLIKASGRQHAK